MSELSYKKIIEGQLPLDLYKSKDLESQAIGNTLDKLQANVDKLERDTNPLTAISKGLEQWEKFFKLPSNNADTFEIRRAKVISELIQFMSDENVIRKDEMEYIMSLFGEVNIIEYFEDYIFEIVFNDSKGLNLEEIGKVIQLIKPSWLDYTISIAQLSKLLLRLKTYNFDVPYKICNMFRTDDVKGGIARAIFELTSKSYGFDVNYPICNMFNARGHGITNEDIGLILNNKYKDNEIEFKQIGATNLGEGEI